TICFFSFQSSRAHRALHSFPTRRSSDLKRLLRVSCAVFLVLVLLFTSQVPSASWSRFGSLTQQWIQGSWLVLTEKPVIDVVSARSEEHTSELQSREKLVCRLLLEKKKYQ